MPPSDKWDQDDLAKPPVAAVVKRCYGAWEDGLLTKESLKEYSNSERMLLPYFKKDDIKGEGEEILRNGAFEKGTQQVEIIHRIFLRLSANCFLSHVESPSCVWVKLHNHITSQLDKPLINDGNELGLSEHKCTKFRYCYAPRTDKTMSRARILSTAHDPKDARRTYCYVLYIDYGNTQWVSLKTLYPLPEKLFYHPWQAIPVALFPLVQLQEYDDSLITWSEEICELLRNILEEFSTLRLKIAFGTGKHTCFNTSKAERDNLETIMPIIGSLEGFNEEFPEGVSIIDELVVRNDSSETDLFSPEESMDPYDFVTRNGILWSDRLKNEVEAEFLWNNIDNIPTIFLEQPELQKMDWAKREFEKFEFKSVAPLDMTYLRNNKFFLDSGEVVLKISSEQRRNPTGFFRASLVKPEPEERAGGKKVKTEQTVLANHFDHYVEPVNSFDNFSRQLQYFYGNPENRLPMDLDQAKYHYESRPVYGIYHCIQTEGEQAPLHLRYRRVKFIKMQDEFVEGDAEEDSPERSTYLILVEFIDFGFRDNVISSSQSLLKIHESHCVQPPFLTVMRICFKGAEFWNNGSEEHKIKFQTALRRDRLYVGNIHELDDCKNNKRGEVIHVSNLREMQDESSELKTFEKIFRERVSEPEYQPQVKSEVVRSWHKIRPGQIIEIAD